MSPPGSAQSCEAVRYRAADLHSSFPGVGRQSVREQSSAATSLLALVSAALGSFPGGLSFAY